MKSDGNKTSNSLYEKNADSLTYMWKKAFSTMPQFDMKLLLIVLPNAVSPQNDLLYYYFRIAISYLSREI